MSSGFELTGSEVLCEGSFVTLLRNRYRHADGEEAVRDVIEHPGAVGIVVLDGDQLWLVRQPREAVGVPDLLEIPAGKLDVAGESPLETAKRELAEEIGKQASSWEEVKVFYTSPGFSDERVWWYLAQGLSSAPPAMLDEGERIEIVRWPLERVDQAIDECEDSKSLIALLWLALALERGELGVR
jgi:ADP-ribose pyrophosphatase